MLPPYDYFIYGFANYDRVWWLHVLMCPTMQQGLMMMMMIIIITISSTWQHLYVMFVEMDCFFQIQKKRILWSVVIESSWFQWTEFIIWSLLWLSCIHCCVCKFHIAGEYKGNKTHLMITKGSNTYHRKWT